MPATLTRLHAALLAAALLALPARADVLGFELGSDSKDNKNPVSGSAGPDGSQGESAQLEKCAKPFGTLAVSEPQDYVGRALMGYGLPSPVPMIRMIIQQSNCFVVVERGRAMQNLMQERQLAESGQLRRNSNMGAGQMVTADYVLTPDVAFSNKDAGGLGAALGAFGGWGGALLAGGLKFKEAQTSMTLADTRSSLQVAAAQGSAKKTDFSLGGLLGGGGGMLGLGAYENTAEGKVISASFLDNWNNIVRAIRNSPQLARQENVQQEYGKVATADGWHEGDVLVTKIANVKLLDAPGGKTLASMARGEELVFMGKEKDGHVKVQGGSGEGWVSKALVKRN
jgi:curli biogenesis system outer membrane secretion channel CsgG